MVDWLIDWCMLVCSPVWSNDMEFNVVCSGARFFHPTHAMVYRFPTSREESQKYLPTSPLRACRWPWTQTASPWASLGSEEHDGIFVSVLLERGYLWKDLWIRSLTSSYRDQRRSKLPEFSWWYETNVCMYYIPIGGTNTKKNIPMRSQLRRYGQWRFLPNLHDSDSSFSMWREFQRLRAWADGGIYNSP